MDSEFLIELRMNRILNYLPSEYATAKSCLQSPDPHSSSPCSSWFPLLGFLLLGQSSFQLAGIGHQLYSICSTTTTSIEDDYDDEIEEIDDSQDVDASSQYKCALCLGRY